MQDSIPVMTANFSPLRFVLRDNSDDWNFSLRQIADRDYDYVKLHRLSTYLDVGIAPFSMGVCFDGTLILPATPEYRKPDEALSKFNEALAELLVGGIYCEAVTPDNVGYGSLSPTAYVRIHGGGSGPVATLHLAARTMYLGTFDRVRLEERETVTVDELRLALQHGRELLRNLGDIPREQLLYGASFFVKRQWAESLIHVWTTTERIVEIAWQKHVVKAMSPTSKRRREFLKDNRTWPISAKIEVLFQKGLFPFSLIERLSDVRKARNEFAHGGVLPDYEVALLAFESCLEAASLCSSEHQDSHLFNQVVDLVKKRCNPDIYPKKSKIEAGDVKYWWKLPPLPGDKAWGDKEYEVIEELCPTDLIDGVSEGAGEGE